MLSVQKVSGCYKWLRVISEMAWRLFLDDIRFPINGDWIIARNYEDACWCVINYGLPDHISFDHDLAPAHYIVGQQTTEKNGYDFAKWLSVYVMDQKLSLPAGFSYAVHSMNPVGAENISKFMERWLREYRLG